jgi:hypothetical protein
MLAAPLWSACAAAGGVTELGRPRSGAKRIPALRGAGEPVAKACAGDGCAVLVGKTGIAEKLGPPNGATGIEGELGAASGVGAGPFGEQPQVMS